MPLHSFMTTQQTPPDIVLINKKKRTCNLMDFDVPVEHRV